jgi:hypothetical protein
MTNGAYTAWLDVMPIDDVQQKIERLEHKLSDLRVLERLHAERQPTGPEAASERTGQETWSEPADAEASAEPISAEASSEPGGEEA